MTMCHIILTFSKAGNQSTPVQKNNEKKKIFADFKINEAGKENSFELLKCKQYGSYQFGG